MSNVTRFDTFQISCLAFYKEVTLFKNLSFISKIKHFKKKMYLILLK